jgi:hypothetical protein
MLKSGNKARGTITGLLAGHPYEKRVVESIRRDLEGRVDEVKVVELQILFWQLKYSSLRNPKGEIGHVVMPYSPSVRMTGKAVRNVMECRDGDVLLVEGGESLYEMTVLAWENGCGAVIVRDNKRRISVSPPLLNLLPTPPPVPLIYVNGADFPNLGPIEIDVETKSSDSTGLILRAIKNGNEEKIIICSNHDTWLSGDDVKLESHKVFEKLKSNKLQLEYISFSGVETGTPGFASLYWGHGVREFLGQHHDYKFAIEIGRGESIVMSPGMEFPSIQNVTRGLDPFSITFEAVREGIPSIYFGIPSVDNVEQSSSSLGHLINELSLLKGSLWRVSSFVRDYFDILLTLPVEVKSYLTNLEGLTDNKAVQILLKRLGRIVGLPGDSVEYYPFHKLQAIRKAKSKAKVYAEGKPSLTVFGIANNEYKGTYLFTLEREITKEYIYEMYNDLKELF